LATVEAGGHDESLCRRCGRCCYRKLLVGDRIYYLDVPCPYLDTETRLCTVYERRHEVNPDCLDVEEGIRIGVFPADCPYVQGLEDYAPPVESPDPAFIAEEIARLEAEEAGS
jgi:uncharacterized cysteine cluster protein YcgN (CxxCxxCC family)